MSNVIDIAELNPVKFYDVGYDQQENYLSKFMDDYLFRSQIRSYEEKVDYFQKWMDTDTINLQFSSNYGPLEVNIIDCNDVVVRSVTPGVYSSNIINQPFFFYQAFISMNGLSGEYYLQLKAGSGVDIKYFVSEPIIVSETFENSVLISYLNTVNDFDIAFDTGIEFSFRVEGGVTDFSPENKSRVYEDQNLNSVNLSSFPFRSYKLTVGSAEGVPDWVADKINRIFACDKVKIDGKLFVRTEGKMERQGEINYPMNAWTLSIREAVNKKSTRFETIGTGGRQVGVVYNLESNAFGDMAMPASNTQVTIIDVE